MSASMLIQIWTDTGKVASNWSIAFSVRFQAGKSRLVSRSIYLTRLAYWTARHRSLDTARWVVEYEGHSW